VPLSWFIERQGGALELPDQRMNQRPASRGRGGRGNSRATVFNSPTQNIARLGSMTISARVRNAIRTLDGFIRARYDEVSGSVIITAVLPQHREKVGDLANLLPFVAENFPPPEDFLGYCIPEKKEKVSYIELADAASVIKRSQEYEKSLKPVSEMKFDGPAWVQKRLNRNFSDKPGDIVINHLSDETIQKLWKISEAATEEKARREALTLMKEVKADETRPLNIFGQSNADYSRFFRSSLSQGEQQ